ncbi:MAG: YegS/Rv2252/BmrU family lipid kinase [Candidatus Dormibacteraceae bacterium]
MPKINPGGGPLAERVLIISSGAGSITPEIDRKLREAFANDLILDFNPKDDFRKKITPDARVVVAGGDGTIGFVARALIDSKHTLGILSLGTYNNFARSLGMPSNLDAAIRTIKNGRPRNITLGRINGKPFLEAAAIGMFGAAIELGEAAKDRTFGELGEKLAAVTGAKPFEYRIRGDIEGHGMALSLVFANTPSIGAAMLVGDNTPIDPYLELSVHAGESKSDIFSRILSGRLRKSKGGMDMGFRFRKITIETRPKIHVFADNEKAGFTPVEIAAELGALNILLTEAKPKPTK